MGDGTVIAPSARIFGSTKIGRGCLVDEAVTIGYPIHQELRNQLSNTRDICRSGSFNDFLERSAHLDTFLGDDAILRSGATVYEGCNIGVGADFGHHSTLREHCNVGDAFYLGAGAIVQPNCNIGAGTKVTGFLTDRTSVGSYCTVSGSVVHRYLGGIRAVVEPTPVLSDGVVIGKNAAVVGAVVIGRLAFVGANSVVINSVPPGVVVAGNPARVIRDRTRDECPELWEKVGGL